MEEKKPRVVCPKCGAKPTSYSIFRIKGHRYVYLQHYSSEEKKMHRWVLGRADNPLVDELLRQLNVFGMPKRLVISQEEIPAFLQASGEIWEKIKRFSSKARKIVVLFYK